MTRIVNLTVLTKWRPSCQLPTDPFRAFYPGYSFFVDLSEYCTLRPQEKSERMSEIYFEFNKDWNGRSSCILGKVVIKFCLSKKGYNYAF